MPEGPLGTIDNVVVTGTTTPPPGPVVTGAESLDLDGFVIGDGVNTFLAEWQQPIAPLRPEWIESADSDGAILARSPLAENAVGTVTFEVRSITSTPLTRVQIEGVVADFTGKLRDAGQTPGGLSLTWTPQGSDTQRTYYVLSGEITELPTDHMLLRGKVARVTATLTCRPYWYADPKIVGPITASGPVMTMDIPDVGGDAPAEAVLWVTDLAGQPRRFVEAGTESRYYTPLSAPSLLIDSDSLMTNGYAGAQGTTTGSYDPNATGSNSIVLNTLSSTPMAVCATTSLTHIGSYRVKARLLLGSGVYAQLAWRTGDGIYKRELQKASPTPGAYTEMDLGEVRIPAPVSGSQRWTARIDAYATGGGTNIAVDYLRLVPTSDFYNKATATSPNQPGIVVATDLFTGTTAGNALNGRATTGGTWATSGATTDFTFRDAPAAGDENVARSTNAAEASPRVALLGSTNYTDVSASVFVRADGPVTPASNQFLILRAVDASNYLRFVWQGANSNALRIETVIAGAVSQIDRVAVPFTSGTWYQIEGIAYATGKIIGRFRTQSGALLAQLTVFSSLAATGGTLASGKPGIGDYLQGTTSSTVTRYFDELVVSTIAPEPVVINANRRLEMRYDATETQSTSGISFAPVHNRGGRFYVKPGRTTRLAVTALRDNVEAAAMGSNFTDSTQLAVTLWPRYYAAP